MNLAEQQYGLVTRKQALARRFGLTSPHYLARRFIELGGRGKAGSGKVIRLIEAQKIGTRPLESRLEVKVWRLIRAAGIPTPERQVRISVRDGTEYRVDMLWRDERIVVECDGFEAHSGHLRWKRDRRRCSAIEALDLRIVHVTWEDVTRWPDETVERLRLAISGGGRRMPTDRRFPLVRGRG